MRTVEVFEINRRRRREVGPMIEFVQTLTVPAGHLHPVAPAQFNSEVIHYEYGPVEAVVLPDGTTHYLAIQPVLRDLLEAPIRQEFAKRLNDARVDLEHARCQWMSEQKRAHRLLWRQEKFKALPWWRRLSHAIAGDLPEMNHA